MTIHGPKLELKRLIYLENWVECISTLPNAITFDSTFRISTSLVFWKLDIQIILGTPRLAQWSLGRHQICDQSRNWKKSKRLMLVPLKHHQKKKKKPDSGHFWSTYLGKFSLFSSLNSLLNTSKNFRFLSFILSVFAFVFTCNAFL